MACASRPFAGARGRQPDLQAVLSRVAGRRAAHQRACRGCVQGDGVVAAAAARGDRAAQLDAPGGAAGRLGRRRGQRRSRLLRDQGPDEQDPTGQPRARAGAGAAAGGGHPAAAGPSAGAGLAGHRQRAVGTGAAARALRHHGGGGVPPPQGPRHKGRRGPPGRRGDSHGGRGRQRRIFAVGAVAVYHADFCHSPTVPVCQGGGGSRPCRPRRAQGAAHPACAPARPQGAHSPAAGQRRKPMERERAELLWARQPCSSRGDACEARLTSRLTSRLTTLRPGCAFAGIADPSSANRPCAAGHVTLRNNACNFVVLPHKFLFAYNPTRGPW